MTTMPRWRLPAAGLLALLIVAYLVYLPGLSGGYLFDDFVNLDAIGATGPVDNWSTFFRYITSGTADPTGRPLALLSFLVDARDWPADPAPFLRTNLLLHLLNGTLLVLLLRTLGARLDGAGARVDAAALLGAGFWLLHPLFVSTTLYIVQREAMLPATFMMLGLLCYLRGHALAARGDRAQGTLWMVSGIVGGTALALLSKGNGILLPLLAWTLESTVLRPRDADAPAMHRAHRRRRAVLGLPSLALICYLGSFLGELNTPIPHRGWSIGERLLTETRVIVDYLNLLVVPRSVSTGLYNDAYVISTGLLQPPTTLFCVALVLALLVIAWRSRRRYPAFSAALLFFFSAHLLESTVIPLELFFEHRNYLPALLFFWPLARWICGLRIRVRWRLAMASGLLVVLAATTLQRAALWGEPHRLAELWAQQNPKSARAQSTIAMLDTGAGRSDLALQRLGPLWKEHPNDLQIAFNYVNAACASRGLSDGESEALASTLEHAEVGLRLIQEWLGKSMELAASGQCQGLDLSDSQAWLDASMRNLNMTTTLGRGEPAESLMALLALHERDPDKALRHFNLALRAHVSPDAAARQASLLARAGYYTHALAHLDVYEQVKGLSQPPGRGMPLLRSRVLQWQNYWPREMSILRQKLEGEIKAGSASDDINP